MQVKVKMGDYNEPVSKQRMEIYINIKVDMHR